MTVRRTPVARRTRPIVLPADPTEASDADRIHALRGELRMLQPYASSRGLARLKTRVREIEDAIHRLTGLPLDEQDDA